MGNRPGEAPPSELSLTDFQQRVMVTPEDADLFLGGGRGGGKSYALAMIFIRHAEQYGPRARMLFIRRSFPGIVDFEATTREVFGVLYGNRASYNGGNHFWRLPGGATLALDQYEGYGDFAKFQGKSYSLIAVDEAGQYEDPAPLDLLRSSLRAPAPIVPRFVMAANPGGVGHGWLVQRHIYRAPAWAPYVEPKTGRTFINCPSTYRDNDRLDQAGYQKQLAAATATDPELYRAWNDGDWSIARGAYFSAVLDEARVMIEPWDTDIGPRRQRPGGNVAHVGHYVMGHPSDYRCSLGYQRPPSWEMYLAHDFGVSAPSVTYVVAISPGIEGPDGRYYPKGSVILLDELATNEPGSLNRGMGYVVPILAEQIIELAKAWDIRPEGVADDAIFAKTGSGAGSISDEFRRAGVSFYPAKKADRLTGWETMRRLLADAGKPDVPGLYVSRRCEYFWQTVPSLARDPKRPDDVDSRGADHAADACRYAVVGEHRPTLQFGQATMTY